MALFSNPKNHRCSQVTAASSDAASSRTSPRDCGTWLPSSKVARISPTVKTQEVLDQALDPFLVPGFQPDTLVEAESGVFPAPDVLDDFVGDLAFPQQQRADLLFPELEKRLGGQLGQWQEGAGFGQEYPFAHQGMDVRMTMNQLTKGLDGSHHARDGVGPAAGRSVDGNETVRAAVRHSSPKSRRSNRK
jgi:hypothetical protein